MKPNRKTKRLRRAGKSTRKISVSRGFGPRHAENSLEGSETDVFVPPEKQPGDTVPAMLTPREAVLNRNAAELMGRDEIEDLNKKGNTLAKQGVDLAAGKGESDVSENEQRMIDEDEALIRKTRSRIWRGRKPDRPDEKFDPSPVPIMQELGDPIRYFDPRYSRQDLILPAQEGDEQVEGDLSEQFKRPVRSVEKMAVEAVPRNVEELQETLGNMMGNPGDLGHGKNVQAVARGALAMYKNLQAMFGNERKPMGSQEWWDAAVPTAASAAAVAVPGGGAGLRFLKQAQRATPRSNWPWARYEVHVDQRLGEFDRQMGDLTKEHKMSREDLLEQHTGYRPKEGPTTLQDFGEIRKANEQRKTQQERQIAEQENRGVNIDPDAMEAARKKFHERGSYRKLQTRGDRDQTRQEMLKELEARMTPEQRAALRQYDIDAEQTGPSGSIRKKVTERQESGLKRDPLSKEETPPKSTFTMDPKEIERQQKLRARGGKLKGSENEPPFDPSEPPEGYQKGKKTVKQKPAGYQGGDDEIRQRGGGVLGGGASLGGMQSPMPGLDWQHKRNMAQQGPGLEWQHKRNAAINAGFDQPALPPGPFGGGPFGEPPRGGGGVLGQGMNPQDWRRMPSNSLYPPGQGMQYGEEEVAPIGTPAQPGVFSNVQLSAPQMARASEALKQAGLSSNQITSLLGAGKGMFGDASTIGGGIEAGTDPVGYSGGISDIGWPPRIAPGAEFHYDKGGWVGKYDNDFMIPAYAGGTDNVPGYQGGRHDVHGNFAANRDLYRYGDPGGMAGNPSSQFDAGTFDNPAGPWNQLSGARPGFPWSPTLINTNYNPQGYPRAVPVFAQGADYSSSGPQKPNIHRKYE